MVASISDDQPILVPVGGEIRHQAEPVALIAAPDRETLREAKRRVTLRTAAAPARLRPARSTHVFAHYELARGDVDAALAAADVVVEGTYRVGHQEQLYIENNAMIALPREDGGITVHGSLQCPYYVHQALIAGMALDDAHVQVVQAETGGGFGGKEEYPSMIALHAALLARRTGKPVRMIYDRHEDLSATTKRHPAVIHHRTGVTRDGRIVAQDIDLVLDGGAYTTLTPVVLSRATIHAGGPYDVRQRPHPGRAPWRPTRRPTARSAASARPSPSSPPRCRSTGPPTRSACRRSSSGAGSLPAGGVTPTKQVLGVDVAGTEVLERAAEASEFERTRAQTARPRAPSARTAGATHRARASASRSPGTAPGSRASGEEKLGSSPASS